MTWLKNVNTFWGLVAYYLYKRMMLFNAMSYISYLLVYEELKMLSGIYFKNWKIFNTFQIPYLFIYLWWGNCWYLFKVFIKPLLLNSELKEFCSTYENFFNILERFLIECIIVISFNSKINGALKWM